MLDIYAREFVAIGNFLQSKCDYKDGHILVDRDELKDMMNRNRYDTAENKLKMWKSLRWITPEDERRVTKRVYVPEQKKYVPKVAINLQVLATLKMLQERKK